ncbi:MAG: hypothetical protein ACT6R7_10920 [Brevundimonas aurantiaca]|jgi:hypothetical protein|uniref:hypothetical protein n=1 Tax=Brevundimonas aurantiaca TaxID=74316 RepID=UPI0025C76A79|nr:hypothetical protein LTR94_011544 [Friedmanniomyces endolithicus]
MTDEADDPMDRIRDIADRRRRRIDQHDKLREDPQFKAAMGRIDRLIMDYGLGLTVIDLMATRWPEFFEQLITLRVKQQFVESMVAAGQAIKEGLHNPARRELRFLLEASIKTLWLDTGSPAINGVAPLATVPGTVDEKVAALDDLGRERFGEVIDSLTFRLMDPAGADTYRQTANSLYGRLSTHVHISSTVIGKDLKGFDKDRDFGFETVGDVNAMADLMRQVLDLALASHFEAFDAGLVGDMFVALFDDMDRWSFRKTPLVSAVSRRFDDKAERKP